jgi:hypothetical protein
VIRKDRMDHGDGAGGSEKQPQSAYRHRS